MNHSKKHHMKAANLNHSKKHHMNFYHMWENIFTEQMSKKLDQYIFLWNSMFLGLKWLQIFQIWTQKFLCSSKITNRQLSKPYDISTNQTEKDANVNNCWQVFPVWCNTELQHIEFQQNIHPSSELVNIVFITSLKTIIFTRVCVCKNQ